MRKISLNGNYLCLLLLVVPLCFVVDAKKSLRQRDIDAVWTRRLFARQKISTPMETRSLKCKSEVSAPVRRCSPPRGSCSSSDPCCGPCSFCHCRFFNAICRCWKIKPPCLGRRKIPCTSFK
ncbi:agouti-signaling protein-like [Hippocampus comes]|uniref:Agouti-signaling protein-like n=1 Tax=Hippocampus comes TaxID=109280 RepID=A0A3Q2YT50_HIPCM|nr:PREDICTED: agouti-signaling protein-like [Hippocampus comes]